MTVVTMLALLLVLVVVDGYCSPIHLALRWTLLIVWFILCLGVAIMMWITPMRKSPSLLQIARWLEIRHPELDERVSTALELSTRSEHEVSAGLLAEISRAAKADLAAIDPRLEIRMKRTRRWLFPALALLMSWILLVSLAPNWTARHVVRVLVPQSRLGNSMEQFTVDPGSVELIDGDDLQMVVHCNHPPVTSPEITIHLADGSVLSETMRQVGETYIYHLEKVSIGFDYDVRIGRLVSDSYRVTVWPRPRLVDAHLRLEFPDYTGLASREQEIGDGVTAVVGTRATLHAALNTPISEAQFELDSTAVDSVRMEHSAAGGALNCDWTLAEPGRKEALLTLKHRLGHEFEGARFAVEAQADAVPEVKWTRPTAKELKVRPDEVLELVYQASDDFGLATVEMEVKPSGDKEFVITEPLPELLEKSKPPVRRGEIRQPIGALLEHWPNVSVLKLRMRVADGRPQELGGPNHAVSDWITLRLDKSAESLARQELLASHAETRDTLEQARREVEEARWKIESKRDELKIGKMNDVSRKELEKAREQLADAHEKLQSLAERMTETPHAPKAEAIREAAAKAERAREQLENTPLQDDAQAREQMANAARQDAVNAENQLRDMLEKVQRDEPKLHDLARLEELSQRQNELARQAERASDTAKANTPPTADWNQRQSQAAWELRDFAAQHPQAKAEVLNHAAENARKHANEARKQAIGQQALKNQTEQLKQAQSPSSQDLRSELAKEQTAIRDALHEQVAAASARQDKESANTLPEAARAADQAASALQQPDPAAAADAIAKVSEQLSKTAANAEKRVEKNGSSPNRADTTHATEELGELATRQKQVADAAKELASGNEDAARQKLAGIRANQVAKLANEIQKTPQVSNMPSSMHQAASETRQASDHANHAAQQPQAAQATTPHAEAATQLQQAAAHLDQAAGELANQASQAASSASSQQQAPIEPIPLADALQDAVQASHSPSAAAAASHARAAADALAQAARATRNAMRQGTNPTAPNRMADGKPGSQPDGNLPNGQVDSGVPPEMAKLGISAGDWEQIKSSLKAESNGDSNALLPEEYRDLVKRYFEQMTKGGNDE